MLGIDRTENWVKNVGQASLLPESGDILKCILRIAYLPRFARTTASGTGLPMARHTVSYCADVRLPFPRPGSDFFAVAAIPAARSFAIRLISLTGTGLVSGKWTVPFRRS